MKKFTYRTADRVNIMESKACTEQSNLPDSTSHCLREINANVCKPSIQTTLGIQKDNHVSLIRKDKVSKGIRENETSTKLQISSKFP